MANSTSPGRTMDGFEIRILGNQFDMPGLALQVLDGRHRHRAGQRRFRCREPGWSCGTSRLPSKMPASIIDRPRTLSRKSARGLNMRHRTHSAPGRFRWPEWGDRPPRCRSAAGRVARPGGCPGQNPASRLMTLLGQRLEVVFRRVGPSEAESRGHFRRVGGDPTPRRCSMKSRISCLAWRELHDSLCKSR